MKKLSIRTWLEPIPEMKGVAVVFDVFRCSTTIHSLFSLDSGEVLVAPSLKEVAGNSRLKTMRVFSELSQPVEALERYDNSPTLALARANPSRHTSLVATTTGTPAMFAARGFDRVYVGSLVNFSKLVSHLSALDVPVTLIPAAVPEWNHYEDELTAQAMATALEGFSNMPEFVRQCADYAKERIIASGRPAHLAGKLSTGEEDTSIAMSIDRFPQLLALEFEQGPRPHFAKVRTL